MEFHQPPQSRRDVVSRALAQRQQIPEQALRRHDVQHPARGLYAPAGLLATEWDQAAAWARSQPGITINSLTAARYWGFRLPRRHRESHSVHLNRGRRFARLRREGITATHHEYQEGDTVVVERDLRVTSPLRTLYDLLPLLTGWEFIAAAEGLVNVHERGYDTLDRRLATLSELLEFPRRHPGARGIRRFAQLSERVRVGSDSVQETYLRLDCEDHGIEDLIPGYAVYDDDGNLLFQSDLAHRASRTSVQYEGLHHALPEQLRRDVERARRTHATAWHEVRVTYADTQTTQMLNGQRASTAVALIWHAIHRND